MIAYVTSLRARSLPIAEPFPAHCLSPLAREPKDLGTIPSSFFPGPFLFLKRYKSGVLSLFVPPDLPLEVVPSHDFLIRDVFFS